MTDEATLLALARGDDEAWPVYADWLEARGDEDRAAVVRLHRRLAAMALADDLAIVVARELLELAAGLPRAWLAQLATPGVIGTCWGARDASNGVYVIAFRADGTIGFRQGTPDDGDIDEMATDALGDGTWMQIGHALTFSIQNIDARTEDYSRHDGVVFGDRMRGIASDINGGFWSWGLAPTDPANAFGPLPELPETPIDSDRSTTIAHDALPERRWA